MSDTSDNKAPSIRYYRHADHSFWCEPPPDAYIEISAADLPKVQAALDRGDLPRLESDGWKVYEPDEPPSDVRMHNLRLGRDRRLRNSDWTQMPDSPLNAADQALWRQYRQALRDLPQAHPDGKAVIWPNPPDAKEKTPHDRATTRTRRILPR